MIFHRFIRDSDTYTTYITDVEVSPEWVDDETVLFADLGNDRAYRSTDGGGRFIRANSRPASGSLSWLVIDRNTRLVGADDGKIYRTTNNGTTWSGKTAGGDIYWLSLDPNNPDNVLAGSNDDKVYFSDDGGGSWTGKGEPDTGGLFPMAIFDPDYASNDTWYAVTYGDDGVYRRDDTTWDRIDNIDGTIYEDMDDTNIDEISITGSWGIAIGDNTVLYAIDTGGDPLGRSPNPLGSDSGDNGVFFETMSDEWPGGDAWGLWITPGSNMVWTISEDKAEIYTWTDEIKDGPGLTAPGNAKSSMRTDEVTLTWGTIGGSSKYFVQWSEDDDFDSYESELATTEHLRIPGLRDGVTYYWRVAVYPDRPATSLWSDTWSFTTALAGGEWNPFLTTAMTAGNVAPPVGDDDVILMPTFRWEAADWATGYQFQLADNANFTSPIVSETVPTTAYVITVELDYSTTYYWRVRAVSSSSQSEWGAGVFTTMGKPAPPPPPSPTPTFSPPAPTIIQQPIPMWALVAIIVVGGVLVIVVIVLIVRTRRPM
jgi:hypothetical protein